MIQRRRLLASAGLPPACSPPRPRSCPQQDREDGRAPPRPFDAALLLREVRAGRDEDRDHRVRQPDRRQERRRHQVGRLRHLRHRRRHPGRRGRRARHGRGRALQQGHGHHLQGRLRHEDTQGPQGQEGRHLAGLDAGGVRDGAPAHGRNVDQGRDGCARAVRRDANDAGARRHRRLCRRRAGSRALDHRGTGPARRISLFDGDGRPEHDLRDASPTPRQSLPSWCR